MKKTRRLVAAILLTVLLSGCFGGDVSEVKRTVGHSELYGAGEIRVAMEKVISLFDRNFDGCTLIEIVYDEDFSSRQSADWAEQYGAEEAIVFYSSFRTGSQTQSLEPNRTYENYQWILTRSKGFGWVLRTWGYG